MTLTEYIAQGQCEMLDRKPCDDGFGEIVLLRWFRFGNREWSTHYHHHETDGLTEGRYTSVLDTVRKDFATRG